MLCIAPGAIATPINQDVWQNPAGLADLIEKIPLRRIGTTEEIARMVVVLASGRGILCHRNHRLCRRRHDRLSRLRPRRLIRIWRPGG